MSNKSKTFYASPRVVLCVKLSTTLPNTKKSIFVTPLTFDPQPLPRVTTVLHHVSYQKMGNWILNILELIWYKSEQNWMCYREKTILTFLWPSPWPLIRSLPKSNRFVLSWCQTNPPNFMTIRLVVFAECCPQHCPIKKCMLVTPLTFDLQPLTRFTTKPYHMLY